MKKKVFYFFSLLSILAFAIGMVAAPQQANACGISDEASDEMIINGDAGWQAQAFEGMVETCKATEIYQETVCGDDIKIEDSCELKFTDMYFLGVAGTTTAEASLCRTGSDVGGEGMFMSEMYMDVVIPLPFPCTWAYVSGGSMSYVDVWAY